MSDLKYTFYAVGSDEPVRTFEGASVSLSNGSSLYQVVRRDARGYNQVIAMFPTASFYFMEPNDA